MQSKISNSFLLALSLFSAAVKGKYENMTQDEFHKYNAGRTLSVGYVCYHPHFLLG